MFPFGRLGGLFGQRQNQRHPPPPAAIEPLESRTLLSWPTAPFTRPELENVVFVNQAGGASIERKAIKPAGDFDAYQIYFDDNGPATIRTTGPMRLMLGQYGPTGRPLKIDKGSGPDGAAQLQVQAVTKEPFYVVVRALGRKAIGKYGLIVEGVPHAVIWEIPYSSQTLGGYNHSSLSGFFDADFYHFRPAQAGTWEVKVTPNGGLDATIHVFDDQGRPLGGSFTRPLNRTGMNTPETWIGSNLPADQSYFVRVDGRGNSLGFYTIETRRVG